MCLQPGLHDDSLYWVRSSTILRPQPHRSTVPVVRGRMVVSGSGVQVHDLELDGYNVRSDKTVVRPDGLTVTRGDPSPTIVGNYVTFTYVEARNEKGICFIASQYNAPTNVNVHFSRVHACGNPQLTQADVPQDNGSCTNPSGGSVSGCRSDIHDHGIYGQTGVGWTISDNYIYSNTARGISLHYHPDDFYIARNIIDDNGQSGIHYSGADVFGNVADNNFVTDTGNDYNVDWYCGSGCGFTGSTATNNCVRDNDSGSSGTALNRNFESNPLGGLTYTNNTIRLASEPSYFTSDTPGTYVLRTDAPASCTDNDPLIVPGPRTNVAP